MMILKIKNMVCDRCILSVKQLLDETGIAYNRIDLGTVELVVDLNKDLKNEFSMKLEKLGFELLLDTNQQYVEAIKNAITKLVHKQEDALRKYTISGYIEEQIGKDYKWLSHLFSQAEGDTIEHYVIAQKIERVKELVTYNELTIGEIADKLHYSSVAHLSNQFKKLTGKTPSQFKTIGTRKALDKL
jgi:AraC family transcriptional regulator